MIVTPSTFFSPLLPSLRKRVGLFGSTAGKVGIASSSMPCIRFWLVHYPIWAFAVITANNWY